jgi:hypothetical protein
MRLLVVFAFVVVAACKEPPPPPPPPPPPVKEVKKDPDAEVKLSADDRACTRDDECTLITEDCCTCTTLGTQTGVRKDHLEAVIARRTPICGTANCPQAMSNDPSCNARRAKCMNGVCMPDAPGVKPPEGVGVEPIK